MVTAKSVSAESIGAPARDRKLALDQLSLALRSLRPNAWIMPALAAVVCLLFRQWIDTTRLVIWFTMVVITGVPLGIVCNRFGELSNDAPEVNTQVRLSALAYLVFTASWGSMGIFLWAPNNDLNHMMVIMLLACTIAGNGALVGASPALLTASYLSYGLALILSPLQSGGALYEGISVLAVLYIAYMIFMSRQIYLTARKMLLLRYDKNDLIEKLAKSKGEYDAARE